MAITNWGYKRRTYERHADWIAGDPRFGLYGPWSSSTVTYLAGGIQPASIYIGSHGKSDWYAQDGAGGVMRHHQRVTRDSVYIVFPIPSRHVTEAKVKLFIPQRANSSYIICRRITAPFTDEQTLLPATSTEHTVSVLAPVSGGWISLNVADLINDGVDAGVWYGILLDVTESYTYVNCDNLLTQNNVQLDGEITGGGDVSVYVDGQWHKAVNLKIFDSGSWHPVKSLRVWHDGGF